MNKKIYIVETASYSPKFCEWDEHTSVNYFRSRARAAAFCERWMANYKKDFPNGTVKLLRDKPTDRYRFHFADGSIEEYELYSAELH